MVLVVVFPTKTIGGSTSEMTTEDDEGKGRISVFLVVRFPTRKWMTIEDGRRRDFVIFPPNLRGEEID